MTTVQDIQDMIDDVAFFDSEAAASAQNYLELLKGAATLPNSDLGLLLAQIGHDLLDDDDEDSSALITEAARRLIQS